MDRRFRLSNSARILAGGLAGTALGVLLRQAPFGMWLPLQMLAEIVANALLSAGQALAVPLIVSSIVLGAAGLEPMRALGKIAGRTLLWMVCASFAAVLVGAAAGYVVTPLSTGDTARVSPWPNDFLRDVLPHSGALPVTLSVWVGLVAASFGFAYFRNQIDEGHARLLSRWFQAVDEILQPLLRLAVQAAPWAVFLLMFCVVKPDDVGPTLRWRGWSQGLRAALLACLLYGVGVLPGVVWCLARVNPWKLFSATLPAILTAFASGSVEATLPVTMQMVRRSAGISNRVAGVTLSLGAALQRDGFALAWTAVCVCDWRMHPTDQGWLAITGALAACALFGIGAGFLSSGGGVTWILIAAGLDRSTSVAGLGLTFLLARGSAALSVWSQVCAAAVIARDEGEYWVPGPPPSSDELQGLKNDLASADN